MNKHFWLAGFLAVGLIAPPLVFAVMPASQDAVDAVKIKIENARDKAQNQKNEIRNESDKDKPEQPANREQKKNKAKAERQDFQSAMAKEREAALKKLGQEKLARVEEYAYRMFRKFERSIDRLRGLRGRIEIRIAKLEREGKDMKTQRDLLGKADQSIQDAETALAQAKEKLAAGLASDKPKESLAAVKVELKNVEAKLKAAHKNLADVISSIKPGKTETAATSTPVVQ